MGIRVGDSTTCAVGERASCLPHELRDSICYDEPMSTNGKTWFRLRWRTMFLLVVAAIVGWSGYSYWSEYSERAARKARELMAPAVGARCEIALEDNVTVSGTFVKLNDEWVVLSQNVAGSQSETWVPREKVQRMRVEN